MEEFLLRGYRYKFTLAANRQFIGRFDKIEGPQQTLFVYDYTDENGCVPGIRTMPFQWIKQVELIEEENNEIETISLDNTNTKTKKRRRTIIPKMVNNFIA